jgi:hypothetical protein
MLLAGNAMLLEVQLCKDWTKMTVLKLQSYGRYRPLFSKKVKRPE